jgi:F0F1-type ATP synthase assembly protein I
MQTLIVMERSLRKWLNARGVLLMDLVLTTLVSVVIGSALQMAGSTPGGALLWLVIAVMVLGCLTLMRSLRSFGGERLVFLQREAKVSWGLHLPGLR